MRGEQPWKVNRARILRSQVTDAEARLWHRLRARRLSGFKFVRQFPVGPFFADFVCRERLLVVEVDGATHSSDEEIAADLRRDTYFSGQGFRVLRVSNNDVRENLEGVLETILRMLDDQDCSPGG